MEIRQAVRSIAPYLRHESGCGASKPVQDPLDHACICGLRQTWHKLLIEADKEQERIE